MGFALFKGRKFNKKAKGPRAESEEQRAGGRGKEHS